MDADRCARPDGPASAGPEPGDFNGAQPIYEQGVGEKWANLVIDQDKPFASKFGVASDWLNDKES